MNKLLIFRRQIETLIGHLVGEYTLANGYLTPAVSVREGNESLDPDTKVDGLEVIIDSSGDPQRKPLQYNENPGFIVYNVRLVQWSGENLTEAKALIESAYGIKGSDIPVPEEIGPSKQALIQIPSSTNYVSDYRYVAP